MTQHKAPSHKLKSSSSSLAVFTFALILQSECMASTGSSWIQKPSWAAEESSAVHHSTAKEIEHVSEISPFSPGSHNLGLDLGQIFLMGDLTKYSDCIGSQLHYTYGASELFGLDTSIGYSEHSDGKYSMASLLTGMRVNMTWYDKIVPYALVGLGFYKPAYQDSTAPTSSPVGTTSAPLASATSISALLFGIHFGPGIDLQVSRNFFFGAALTIHDMFGTTKFYANGTPLSVGGIYTSFFLHAGVSF